MKKNSQYRLLLPFLLAVLVFVGCTKDDGPVKKEIWSLVDAVPTVSTKIETSGSQAIDLLNLSTFQGKFTVSMYFAGATPPEKVDVVVRKVTKNKEVSVKVFKANVTALPAAFSVTAAEIQTLFGTAILLGDSYEFSVDIYANGKKYEAFPNNGATTVVGSSSGPLGMPGYSEKVNFSAICAYDPAIYQGDFEVVKDEWGDYAVGDVVSIKQESATSFSFKFPESADAKPIIVSVNKGNNVTSVTKQVYTGPTGYGAGYGPISVESVTFADNLVKPCDKTFTVKLKHTVSVGSFGDFIISMKKK